MKPETPISSQALESCTRIKFRDYQWPVFSDRATGVLVLHWSRQIGKSFTLAAWAVDRLLSRPGRLVTVLSNSRDNGAEFLAQCAEICRLNNTKFETEDQSPNLEYQNMRLEIRIIRRGKTGRIKVLAANPRTARGFSGDLILDEFAFHEDSAAIWEAAEPILAANRDYLCRIASTGNGRHNLFYRMGEICRLPKFRRAAIDMTGLGLGLFEYAQEEFGASRIHGINFATSVPATRAVQVEGRKRETVRVTEAMAMELLQVYEDRRIQHPADHRLRDDLRKPGKITTPGGRVSIAATRDEAGHADHFWSFALALEAAAHGGASGAIQVIERPRRYLL